MAGILCVSCSHNYQTLPLDEFEKAISEPNVTVVDVRTPAEYNEGHIAGAINIDWKAGDFAERAAEVLDKEQTVAVYCAHARRSKMAAGELEKMNFKHVIELADGVEVWIKAGKPVEKSVVDTLQ